MSEEENKTSADAAICEAKRGFFTLYDCGKSAHAVCNGCQRHLCLEHFPSKFSQCLECEAKSHSEIAFTVTDSKNDKSKDTPQHDLLAAYHKRDEGLKQKNGSGIYLGKNLNEYYQSYDLRSFDIELSNIADLADSPDEVFFDS